MLKRMVLGRTAPLRLRLDRAVHISANFSLIPAIKLVKSLGMEDAKGMETDMTQRNSVK